jgi:hypothetical protein
MMSNHRFAFVVLAGALAASPSLADTPIAAGSQIKINVPVNVSDLMPEVTQVAVKCVVRKGPNGIAWGAQLRPVSGNYNGVVTVSIDKLLGTHKLSELGQVNNYRCTLILVGPQNTEAFPEPSQQFVWAQPKPDTPFVREVFGSYPPPASDN